MVTACQRGLGNERGCLLASSSPAPYGKSAVLTSFLVRESLQPDTSPCSLLLPLPAALSVRSNRSRSNAVRSNRLRSNETGGGFDTRPVPPEVRVVTNTVSTLQLVTASYSQFIHSMSAVFVMLASCLRLVPSCTL